MKNTDVYGENHHLKVDNIRLKSENKKLKLDKEELEKQLSLNFVSHRRELLKHFSNFLYENEYLKKDNVLMEYEISLL